MKSFIFIYLCALLCLSPQGFSQEMDHDGSFAFEVSLPNSMTNSPYKMIMQGLVQSSIQYQYAFKSGFCIGAGIHYTYFTINEFRVPYKVYGGIHTPAVYVMVGHEKYWTKRFGTDFGVKMGYLQSFTVSDLLRSKGIDYNFVEGTYIEPSVGLILKSDLNQSYRLSIGCPIYGYSFNPWMIGIDSNIGYDSKEYTIPSSLLSVGLTLKL
jgi:hypothetical protein